MDRTFETVLGDVTISEEAIANTAGYVASKCYGVVGMVSKNRRDGLFSLLKRNNMSKGIQVSVSGNMLDLTLHIMVEYGINMNAVSQSIINHVKYRVSECTGMEVRTVNVIVETVRVQK